MKILQINKFFYRRGGAEVHFLDLCHLLESLGHQVIHFSTLNPANEPSPYSQYFIKDIEMRGRYGLWESLKIAGHILYSTETARKLEVLIKKTKPDIAHLHNIYHHFSPSILPVLKKHKIPVVMTLHDYKLICPNYRLYTQGRICERCQKHKYYQAIFHRCIFDRFAPSALAALEMSFHKVWGVYEKNIDVFISPSRFLKDKMREWGIQSKIEVIPNFINTRYEIRDRRYKNGDYLLYFGRLSEEKGLLTLIKAVRQLPGIKLRLVGDGPLKEQLNNLAPHRKGAGQAIKQLNNVVVVGHKTGADLVAEIAGARAVVVPSEWYENCPLSVLEAMSYGKPVIASRLGGLPEIVREGESGRLFSPGNVAELAEKIQWLWSNPKAIKKMGQAAQKQVGEENSPEGYYQELMKIYKP